MADLAITKTDGVTTAVPGGSVTYTITATNAGPSERRRRRPWPTPSRRRSPAPGPASGAGGGTCTAAGSGNINDTVNLPAGGQRHLHGDLHDQHVARPARSSNTATVSERGVTDPNPGNNSATDTDTLVPHGRSLDHQDRRRHHGDPGRLGDLHDRGLQRRPEQRHGRHGGGHLPGVPHLHVDLRGRGRRHLHRRRLGQHQRHRQPPRRAAASPTRRAALSRARRRARSPTRRPSRPRPA